MDCMLWSVDIFYSCGSRIARWGTPISSGNVCKDKRIGSCWAAPPGSVTVSNSKASSKIHEGTFIEDTGTLCFGLCQNQAALFYCFSTIIPRTISDCWDRELHWESLTREAKTTPLCYADTQSCLPHRNKSLIENTFITFLWSFHQVSVWTHFLTFTAFEVWSQG